MPRIVQGWALALWATSALSSVFAAPATANEPHVARASQTGNPFTGDFDKYAAQFLEDWHCAGMAIGIVDGDNVFTKVRIFRRLVAVCFFFVPCCLEFALTGKECCCTIH